MSTEASVEGLPPWPVGARPEEIFELSCIAYDTSLIAALRARLALAVNDLEEMSAALEEKGLHRTAQLLKQTALTCKEPSHG